ncbi:MAG: hypothetical protein AB1696_03210 [Planctomycetota bacterium]
MAGSRRERREREREMRRQLKKFGKETMTKLGAGQAVLDPCGEVKMSEVLNDLIEPYLPPGADIELTRMIVTLGALAWNLSLSEDGDHRPRFHEAGQEIKAEIENRFGNDIQTILSEMIVRKKALFPHHSRYIVNCELIREGGGHKLLVASTLSSKQGEKHEPSS